MLKDRSVNSIIVYVLAGLLYNTVYSQKTLEGVFCVEYDLKDYSVCLTFETNKNFIYEYGDTNMFEYGRGEYEISGNELILNYNKTEPIKTGHHVSEIWTNNKDSIEVHFKVFDFNNNPIPYVNVMYKISLPDNTYTYNGAVADEQGLAKLNLLKENKELQLIISNVGYTEYKLMVDKTNNYNISVFLQKHGDGLPILNQIDTLEIVKRRPKYFTVRNKNGSVTTWRKLED